MTTNPEVLRLAREIDTGKDWLSKKFVLYFADHFVKLKHPRQPEKGSTDDR